MFSITDKVFLAAAFASLVTSVGLWSGVGFDYGIFVGLWVPSILALWIGVNVSALRFEQDE